MLFLCNITIHVFLQIYAYPPGGYCHTPFQIVMLAERGAEHRATAGANVPALEYRRWLAMFASGDPSLGDPVTQPEDRAAAAAAREAASHRDRQLAQATVQDYLQCVGEWRRSEEQGGSIGFNAPLGAVSKMIEEVISSWVQHRM